MNPKLVLSTFVVYLVFILSMPLAYIWHLVICLLALCLFSCSESAHISVTYQFTVGCDSEYSLLRDARNCESAQHCAFSVRLTSLKLAHECLGLLLQVNILMCGTFLSDCHSSEKPISADIIVHDPSIHCPLVHVIKATNSLIVTMSVWIFIFIHIG